MRTKILLAILTVALVLPTTSCFGQSSGQTLNSPEALKTYLDSQPANSPDKPIRVTMTINDPMLKNVADVIKSSGKYVSLNISGNILTRIPDDAFEDCETLVGITIPNGVTSIGWAAFSGCTSLTSITIPNSVTSIGFGAFYGCDSLTSITVGSGNPNYVSEGGILYNKAKTEIIQVPQGIIGAVTIPSGVTSIGRRAFLGCESLTSITIPNSVKSIGEGAFQNTSLTSVTIPNSVTSIESQAFAFCDSLTGVTIPNSVTSIGDGAFAGCDSLTSVTFQGTISSANFDSDAFGFSGPYVNFEYIGDLREKYLAGGVGTYKRESDRDTWTKQ